MSNNENWIFGSALLGLSLVLGAAAAAVAQSSASSSLPAFLDGARLPSLQDTLKQGEGEPTAVARPSNAAPIHDRLVNEPETPSVANAAGQPLENADRPVTTVRQRAEELSRRFGGGATAPTPAQSGAAKNTTSAVLAEPVPAPEQGEQATTVTLEPTNESKRAVSVGIKTAPSSPTAKRVAIPPIPLRAPRTAQVRKLLLPPKSHVGAVPLSKPSAAPSEKPANPQHTIPTQLQSFGWNTQVQPQQ